jgi:anaerobic magnesium-protoporphyrin IX monomethyl ester cyclase
MLATTNYMIGMPGETGKDIEETLALNEEIAPDDFGCFVFYPYPGTVLFDVCRDNGYLPENYLELPAEDGQSILTLPGLTKDEISHYYQVFGRVRENSYLKKYGAAFNEEDQTLAVERLRGGTDAA